MATQSKKIRHILALSGGKDSAALAVYLRNKIPGLEYVFLDTGHELPETYEFLMRMRAILGINIITIKPKRDFDFWLKIYGGCLPSPKNRWCTRMLKIFPYENFIGQDRAYSYVALRADEDRIGYISHGPNIIPYYPFIEDGLIKKDILQILEDSNLGMPKYYSWRSRSGCYFCFFQRRGEWLGLYNNHPDLFERAYEYETNHSDGRIYTWIEGKSLRELLEKKNVILDEAKIKLNISKKGLVSTKRLSEKLAMTKFSISIDSILNDSSVNLIADEHEDDDEKPCLICSH